MSENQAQAKDRQLKQETFDNEYYMVRWSNETDGIVFVKQEEGYSQIRYGITGNNIWVDWNRSFDDFEKSAHMKDLVQISKLDALPTLRILRRHLLDL